MKYHGIYIFITITFLTTNLNAQIPNNNLEPGIICDCCQCVDFVTPSIGGFYDVTDLCVTGDGVTDDAPAIRCALLLGVNLYFPVGTYLLSTPADNKHWILNLNNANNNTTIKFEEGAKILIDPNFGGALTPMAVIQIQDDSKPIENITLYNVEIDANNVDPYNGNNPDIESGKLGGIVARAASVGVSVLGIKIDSARVINCTGSGITSSGADQMFINWAYTSNCVKQGIGAGDIRNDNLPIELHINTHHSYGDGNAVDWSGPKVNDDDDEDNGHCREGYSGFGTAINLTSYNSIYGTKIAGTWDLSIKDVTINNHLGNGFWVNGYCPDITAIMSNINIHGSGNTGFRLNSGNTFNIKGLAITNSGSRNFFSNISELNLSDFSAIGLMDDVPLTNVSIVGDEVNISDFKIESSTPILTNGSYGLHIIGNANFDSGNIKADNYGSALVESTSVTCWTNTTFECDIAGFTAWGDGDTQIHSFEQCYFDNGASRDIRLNPGSSDGITIFTDEATIISPSVGEIPGSCNAAKTDPLSKAFSESSNNIEFQVSPNPFLNRMRVELELVKEIGVFNINGDPALFNIIDRSNDYIEIEISENNIGNLFFIKVSNLDNEYFTKLTFRE